MPKELKEVSNSLDSVAKELNSSNDVSDLIGAFIKERKNRTFVVRSAEMRHCPIGADKENKQAYVWECRRRYRLYKE